MTCTICGDEKTVRSHIIPKAFALAIRDGANHVVAASRHYGGAKPSQGGMFADGLLCSKHEAKTGAPDKYAIEFARRVTKAWPDRRRTSLLKIANPQPLLLHQFALLTIWREVNANQVAGLSLGPYDQHVRKNLFEGGAAPDWPLLVQRTNFQAAPKGAVDFNLHPYRVRFADRSGWSFTVAGIAFFVISDRRGLPQEYSEWRADLRDPAPVTVADAIPLTEVGALKTIMANMLRSPKSLSCS